jgi:hypothetical protein
LHLSLEAIIDVSEGRSKDEHLDQCQACRWRVEEWQQLLSQLHRSQLADAPATLLTMVYGIPEPGPGIG